MKTLRVPLTILSVTLLAFAGCRSNEPTPASSNESSTYDSATATARVSGTIKFEGTPPVMEPIKAGGSRFCVVNARDIHEESALVTKDGLLENVIVYVRTGFEGKTYNPPDTPVVLDQKRCVYVPHVLTIMAKQKMKVLNSDDTFHNVHSMSQVNNGFNFAQTKQNQENEVTFDKAEAPFRIGCDLHKWMGVWVGVFEHPFHTSSGDTGHYELKLPPGKYEIAAWHEKFGEKVLPLEVTGNGQAELNFTFSAK